jgi:hypothetical protein
MRNKKFNNLIIFNLTSKMKRGFERKRNASKGDERPPEEMFNLKESKSVPLGWPTSPLFA